MAKIKFGMMMTDARGKLGGQVFSKNKGGAYVRTKVTPSNPQTTFQSFVRSLFASISANWSSLTEAQRSAWNTAVDVWKTTDIFGDLIAPTGKALYQRLNNQAQVVGYSAIVSPPAKLDLPNAVITDAVIDLSSTDITLTGASADATNRTQLFATAQLTAGTKFVKNKLRQIIAPVSNVYSGTDAYTAYVAKFGVPTAGDNVYIGVSYVLPTGQSSPLQIVKATVQA